MTSWNHTTSCSLIPRLLCEEKYISSGVEPLLIWVFITSCFPTSSGRVTVHLEVGKKKKGLFKVWHFKAQNICIMNQYLPIESQKL